MTKLIRYSLSERDVRLWKLRKENPPFKRTDLDRFLKQALKGVTTQEKREKAVQEASENLIEKAKDLSGKIQENNDKELQLLKLDSRVRGLYNEIDSGWVPKQARQTITSGKGKPGTIHSPSKEWLLLVGSFSPDQEVLILHVKELRDERSRLQNELSGIVQKLKVLTAKATTEGMKLPQKQKIEDLLERGSSPSKVVFEVYDQKNYTSFTFAGERYFVGPPQGKGIKLLHEEGMNGSPDVLIKDIKKVMGLPQTSNLQDSFKKQRLWNTLIISKKRGTRRLSIFS